MAMSEQKNDLCKEFIKHLLGHGGSYTDLFEKKLVHVTESIMAHLPSPHQVQHVLLQGYVIQCT